MREETLFKTLDSIEKFFPYSYKLYIADDSGVSDEKEYRYQQLEIQGHVIIRLPFDSGLSFGRNEIIRRVKEGYILMLDDDIQLTDSDSIKKMKQVLDSADDIGLCAGIIYQKNGKPFGGHAYSRGLVLEIDNSILFRHKSTGKLAKADGVLYNYADQVVNFFLAKRAIFKSIAWDNRIKIEYEHMDFFLNLKRTKWKVAVCLDTESTHDHQLTIDPIYVRHRFSAPVNYFYGKHGIGRIINRYQQGVGG
jgi:GT2 family glycosyltransferase